MADGKDDDLKVVTDDDLEQRRRAEEEGDDLPSGEEEEEEESRSETRLGTSEEQEEEDDERRRIREERRARRRKQKESRDRLYRELRFLQQRNEQLERRFSELSTKFQYSEESQIAARINQVKAALKKADSVYADAISAGNGEDAAEAQSIRDNLRDHLRELEYAQRQRSARREGAEDSPIPPDPEVAARAREWLENNSWAADKRNPDAQVVEALDRAIMAEGYDPGTDEYWEELDRRVSSALPHRAEGSRGKELPRDRQRRKSNGSGPRFRSSGGANPDLRKGEYYLSRDRVEALKELGVWDDPELRNKYVKRYAEYDRQQGLNTSYE